MSRPYYMPSVEEMIDCGLVDPHQEIEEHPEPPKGYIYRPWGVLEKEDDDESYGW